MKKPLNQLIEDIKKSKINSNMYNNPKFDIMEYPLDADDEVNELLESGIISIGREDSYE
jgi:hypothetical protein